ncbi:hypothetical protein CAC42_6091 [Sphaceloma murrayae]|uniref:Uncharacterized protein n=1 Tax=Sphaceloma murrayae TaxID=2082308 RepID=A0A2K1QV96_9PEZI|nr:hypothetical protein CAC42_6091 [Sphaceloma murrayae]
MNHFAPHPGSGFEGYYSKFDLPSGARIALIFCTIPGAQREPHKVSFTYLASNNEYFQRHIWVEKLEMVKTSDDGSFELRAPGVGYMKVAKDSITEYSIEHEDFTFSGKTTSHLPWSTSTDTPEGPLVYLPLPLHWHVHSLGSSCSYELSIPSFPHVAAQDRSGLATVHQEKNWATSFPSAHIWVQARSGSPPDTSSRPSTSTSQVSKSEVSKSSPYHSLCIAGGQIIGTEAYLLGYRSTTHPSCTPTSPIYELDFRPPFAMRLLGLSPSLTATPSFKDRTFTLSARNWFSRIDVEAKSDPGAFFPLASPFPEGHRDNFLAQSFRADIRVRVYEWVWEGRWWDVRGWWAGSGEGREGVGKWLLKEETAFQDGSLEFGGAYYDWAGSKTKRARA